jgi:5-formyltetrahydrofolate cyclo-ligase
LEALAVKALSGLNCLVMAPGLAFDLDGGRLGRGKGYYDRFLSSLHAARRKSESPEGMAGLFVAAYGYSFQRVSSVPRNISDQAVDTLILA